MSTQALDRIHPSGLVSSWPGRTSNRPSALPTGWPLAAVLCLFPLWWVLGLSTFAFVIAAVPMSWHLIRIRPVRLPPGFAIWLLFLAWAVGCTAVLGVNPPGTVTSTVGHRLISTIPRLLEYAAATITMIYVGNLPRTFAQRRLLGWLSALCIVVVCGGVLGLVAPHFQFASPVELLLPGHLRANLYIHSLFHPTAAQVQNVLGAATGRPAAPFGYTNTWGNCLSVLLVWLVAATTAASRRRTIVILLIAAVPIAYSLNRGMWLGLIGMLIYTAVRGALLGRIRLAVGTIAGSIAIAIVFLATPLHGLVADRLHHGGSNDIRQFTTTQAVKFAEASPIVGYGSTRAVLGSGQSIAVGRTSNCPRCGNAQLGQNGEIWSVLISDGFVGAALYLAFFAYGVARFWKDRSAIGIAGVGVLLLAIGYAFIYNAAGMPLYLYLLSYGLLWRNASLDQARPTVVARESTVP